MAATIDWSYHRPGCTTCGKTQEFLANAGLEAKEEVNAKKETISGDDAIALAAKAGRIIAARGKKVVEIDVKKEKPDKETLAKLVLGPTGNLRAPTLRVGKTLIVGFNEAAYEALLK